MDGWKDIPAKETMRPGDNVRVIGPDTQGNTARMEQLGKVLYLMGGPERAIVIFDKTAALFKIANLEETEDADASRKS